MDRKWNGVSRLVLFWGLMLSQACHQAPEKSADAVAAPAVSELARAMRCASLDPVDHGRWDVVACAEITAASLSLNAASHASFGLVEGACYALASASQPSWISLECMLSASLVAKAAIPLAGREPNEATLSVLVNQRPIARSNWDYDPTSRSIIFTATADTPSLLKEGNTILIRYAETAEDQHRAVDDRVPAVVQDSRGVDGCQFLLKLADGTLLDPVNLAEAFQHTGLAVSVAWRSSTAAQSVCRGSQLVEVTSITWDVDESFANAESRCDELSREFEALVTEIEALDRSCANAAACEAYGFHPRTACPRPRFTTKVNLNESRRSRLKELSEGMILSCPQPPAIPCPVVYPNEVTCGAETQECEGKF